MKFMSFIKDGVAGFGVIKGENVINFSHKFNDLKAMLASDFDVNEGNLIPLGEVNFQPVIPNPAKIICVGVNYASHIAEMGREPGEYPLLFTRFANSQVGHNEPMLAPRESIKFDYEGELAVIIGKGGRKISENEAMNSIAGYSCYNDGSIRDWQRHTSQFTAGKNFVGTGGFGPWMISSDEIPDPSVLHIETRLNGKVMQSAPISDLVFNVPKLIAYISTFTELEAGDVIITGTTGGVCAARTPPVWMKAGDTVEVEISKIGTLINPILDAN